MTTFRTLWRNVRQRRPRPQASSGVEGALHGYFELRTDSLVGWVKRPLGRFAEAMRIDVLRKGQNIASYAADWQPDYRRYAFAIPIDGRFTGADLVTEDVTLVARDNRGDSGVLLLDGAAQLKLIREHLGALCVTDLDLDFTASGNARPHLGAGWGKTDPDFTWAIDDDSIVRFPAPSEAGTYALRITAGAFIEKPPVPRQSLDLLLNEELIAATTFTEPHMQFQEIRFPREAFGTTQPAVLRLHHPDAVRAADVRDTKDVRRLAIRFQSLSVVRLLQPD